MAQWAHHSIAPYRIQVFVSPTCRRATFMCSEEAISAGRIVAVRHCHNKCSIWPALVTTQKKGSYKSWKLSRRLNIFSQVSLFRTNEWKWNKSNDNWRAFSKWQEKAQEKKPCHRYHAVQEKRITKHWELTVWEEFKYMHTSSEIRTYTHGHICNRHILLTKPLVWWPVTTRYFILYMINTAPKRRKRNKLYQKSLIL